MAATMLARFALQTTRLTVAALRPQTVSPIPIRSFSASPCCFGKNKLYTEKHEWIEVEDGSTRGTVGISDFAQESLGEIVFVELPEVRTELEQGDSVGCVESVKAASDIYSPVAGIVAEVNERLSEEPGLVNKSPLDEGWLFKLDISDSGQLEAMMDKKAYTKFIEDNQ